MTQQSEPTPPSAGSGGEVGAHTLSGVWAVTGGAGFLGINLIRHLLGRGASARSLDVADFGYADVRERVDVRTASVLDREAVDRLVEGADVVVHCAAALPLQARQEILETEIEGTRHVLDAALRHRVRRVVHVSSTAVYGVPDHVPVREDAPLHGVGPYGKAKVRAEGLCVEYRARGLPVTVLRPKTFVGPERLGVFEILYDWAQDGRGFPMIGSGDNRYQLLDVEDLCVAIARCAEAEADVADDVFNVGAAEYGTMREDWQAVLDEAGHGRRVVPLPAAPVVGALRVLRALRLSPLYGWVFETAGKDSVVDIERIRERLGFTPRYSNREALIRNFRWYREHLDEFRGQSGTSHRKPWKQGILRLAKRMF